MIIIQLTAPQHYPEDYYSHVKDFGFFATREAAEKRAEEYIAEVEAAKQKAERGESFLGSNFWKFFYCVSDDGQVPINYKEIFVAE
jgi:hypothetical protein